VAAVGPKNRAPNLFYNKKGDVIYFTASVGIVYDDDNNRQRFFLRHDDDIQCLALSPDKVLPHIISGADSAQCMAFVLPLTPTAGQDTVATGQVGAEPIVYIWSSTTLRGPDDPTG
jgi:microtubule-associated protein-like 5